MFNVVFTAEKEATTTLLLCSLISQSNNIIIFYDYWMLFMYSAENFLDGSGKNKDIFVDFSLDTSQKCLINEPYLWNPKKKQT